MCTVPTGQPPFVRWWLLESDCYWIASDFGAFIPFLSFSILFTYEFAIEIQSEKVQILLRRFDADAAHTRTWALKIDLSHPFPLPASWLIEESAPKKHKTTSWIFAKGHPNWFSEDKKVSHEQGIPLWPTQMTEGNHWLLSSALGNSPPMAMDLMFPHYNHDNHRLHGISPYFLHVWLRRVAREWVLHTTKSCFFSLWQNCGFERMREFEEATQGLKWDLERHELKMFWQEKWRLHNSQ